MREWALTEFEEPVSAIIAELVANAVLHAGTDLILRLSCSGSRIRIEVDDRDTRPPVLTEPFGLQEGGRGMVIIARYSTTWGTVPSREGKTVWAEIDLAATLLPWRPV
jgi:anti-sigma regulatory factor (Ser/Thr protein kinase)